MACQFYKIMSCVEIHKKHQPLFHSTWFSIWAKILLDTMTRPKDLMLGNAHLNLLTLFINSWKKCWLSTHSSDKKSFDLLPIYFVELHKNMCLFIYLNVFNLHKSYCKNFLLKSHVCITSHCPTTVVIFKIHDQTVNITVFTLLFAMF